MNYKRKYSKTCGKGGKSDKTDWLNSWPKWWDVVFHRRPMRRRDQERLTQIIHGRDPDEITWDLGNSKPHIYYW